jgi:hypothetical protein
VACIGTKKEGGERRRRDKREGRGRRQSSMGRAEATASSLRLIIDITESQRMIYIFQR